VSETARIALRPAGTEDEELLFRVFYHARVEEFRPAGWEEARLTAFLRDQARLQHAYYHSVFPEAAFDVVEVDGAPAGRLYVDRTGDSIHIIDIALLPEYRGRGVGSALMGQLAEEADAAGRSISLMVESSTPARRLYQRLGFVAGPIQGINLPMRRLPAAWGGGHG